MRKRQKAPVAASAAASSAAADSANQPPCLFRLPQDIERELFFAIGADGLALFRHTCPLGSQRVSDDYLKSQIDRLIVAKAIQNVVSYRVPRRARRDQLRPMDFLLRLLYVIENGGAWVGWEAIVRMAEHLGHGPGKWPIELHSADVEAVGSRAVFDGRCEALRQLSFIGRRISHRGDATLERVNGEEWLDGSQLTIVTLQTLTANHPFRDRFDPNNPVCGHQGHDYASVRDAVVQK
ncbi:unnamed protein product [Vitrella brassicaformis CCMP3155]|uniref:Uncharacterized protein n=1 Tax=Vitrella brassicaformis (strain CCMP3155) TaxID=1169540 RepID=A0A0G4EUG1_VITBC|nr:unnamed protein product [Vitrella brassicaformis CCMP3155]|eukprot:CEM01726.1 unnamed protein product [Vitrella brassicaformis CCMP3155]